MPEATSPAPEDTPPPAKKSWLRRNLKLVIPLGCVGGLVLLVLVAGGVYWFIFLRGGSEVHALALQRIVASPEVIQHLGTPIVAGQEWFPVGCSPDGQDAAGTFTVIGSKGQAEVECEAMRENGGWTFLILMVTPADSDEMIDLAEFE